MSCSSLAWFEVVLDTRWLHVVLRPFEMTIPRNCLLALRWWTSSLSAGSRVYLFCEFAIKCAFHSNLYSSDDLGLLSASFAVQFSVWPHFLSIHASSFLKCAPTSLFVFVPLLSLCSSSQSHRPAPLFFSFSPPNCPQLPLDYFPT